MPALPNDLKKEARESDLLAEKIEALISWLLANASIQELTSLMSDLGGTTINLQNEPIKRLPLALNAFLTDWIYAKESRLSEVRHLLLEKQASNKHPEAAAPIFDFAFFIFGIRRGGNHAISEWIKGFFDPDSLIYLNSAEISAFEYDRDFIKIDSADYTKIPCPPHKKVLIVGYENVDFQDFPIEHNRSFSKKSFTIVVLRDFVNHTASIVRSSWDRPAFAYFYRLKDFPYLWTQYAQHFADQTPSYTFLDYNRWFQSSEYRQRLCQEFGITFSDRGINQVSKYGGGSSFEGLHQDLAASNMNVLNRWPQMINDSLFLFVLLINRKNLELNEQLFDNFPHSYETINALWSAQRKDAHD